MLTIFARAGYAARGMVFVLLGGFALTAAIGARSRASDSKDALLILLHQPFGAVLLSNALLILLHQPFGAVLLSTLASGLFCFGTWRIVQAVYDLDADGWEPKGLARRLVHGLAGLFYLGFACTAFSLLLGLGQTGTGDQAARDWAGWLLEKPFGSWILGAVGLAIAGTGFGIGIAGWQAEFREHLKIRRQSLPLVLALGTVGFLARSFVLVVLGMFVVFAAVDANAREAKGFAGALTTIKRQPYGSVLLGTTALGLISFGAFGFSQAIFREIETKPDQQKKAARTRY